MNSVILLTKLLSSVFDAKYIAKDIPDEELRDAFYKGNLELESAGLVINSKTKYTFNRITRDYVVLFNKKNLKLKV